MVRAHRYTSVLPCVEDAIAYRFLHGTSAKELGRVYQLQSDALQQVLRQAITRRLNRVA